MKSLCFSKKKLFSHEFAAYFDFFFGKSCIFNKLFNYNQFIFKTLAWIGRRSAQLRMRNTKRTDFRVKIMNEILLGIQVIKMYAWEKSFAKMVDQIRK